MKNNLVTTAALAALAASAYAQTTEIEPNTFRIESSVNFTMAHEGASNYLFNWSDSSGSYSDRADPTLVLTAGNTYTFRRTTGSHPFVITDDTLPTSTLGGELGRNTFDGAVIDAATLNPISAFTADPAPTTDRITWVPEVGTYYYTCRVTGHFTMIGLITVVAADPDPRDVQIQSIDFDNAVVELYNYSDLDQDLSGWRMCTHDFDEVRNYSGSSGLNGVTIEAGTSLYLHYNNDAPAGDDNIDIASMGGSFAGPLDQDAYGMQLFNADENGNVNFGNSSLIADHIQWNIDGQSTGNADFRSGQAVSEQLWIGVGSYISTTASSQSIELTIPADGRFHGPSNYTVTEGASCQADITEDGNLNFFDVSEFLNLFGSQDPAADFNNDGNHNFFDVSEFLAAFGMGCP